MDALFLKILNMSIAASWLILAVILLRIILKKAPKWINVLLWGIVAIRLICPFSFESSVSLIPDSVGNGKLVSQWADDYIGEIDIYHPDSIYYDAAIGAGREPISDGEGGYYVVTKHDQLGEPATIENTVVPILSVVWLTGILVMLIYAAVSYFRLIRKVGASIHLQDNIWLCDDIQTPFILGCFKPRIYIPSGTDEAQLIHIIAHENAHLKRRDHWWKPLGFVVLAGHWFNPLVWVVYILLCRDIELACDEKVIRELNQCESIAYSKALLACSVNRRTVMVCPLAFGEVGVKERVKRVLNYKKPAFWLVGVAAISCIVIAVCFLTNPISKNTIVMGANYDIEKVLYAVTVGDEISTEPPLQYCVTADYHLYYQQTEGEDWMHLGALEPYDLTTDELDKYMPVDDMRKNAKVRQITDAYILRVGNDNFYLVFQTEDGKTYLAYGWEDVGERGQAGSDDTRLRRLYLLDSSFHSGYVNVNFFERSLINTVGNYVYNFANFESDKIPGYHIIGFKSGDSNIHTEMNDLGFAVFQTTGEGYRLIDCKVYENAAIVENGIFFCSDPAVADVNGEMRNDNTFDILLILNEDVDKVERVYHADGKEDFGVSI